MPAYAVAVGGSPALVQFNLADKHSLLSFVLVTDNDGHWYVVPVTDLKKWEAFLAIPGTDEDGCDGCDVPAFAQHVGGAPSLIKFTTYKIE